MNAQNCRHTQSKPASALPHHLAYGNGTPASPASSHHGTESSTVSRFSVGSSRVEMLYTRESQIFAASVSLADPETAPLAYTCRSGKLTQQVTELLLIRARPIQYCHSMQLNLDVRLGPTSVQLEGRAQRRLTITGLGLLPTPPGQAYG